MDREYYTTKRDVIEEIERGMGSEGDRKVAKKMFEFLEEDKLIRFDPEMQKYICRYTGDQFLEYWEKADKEMQKELLEMISNEDLTEIPTELRRAIITKKDAPEKFTKEMYQNIYHNLLDKGSKFFARKQEEYRQKIKLAKIFEKIQL